PLLAEKLRRHGARRDSESHDRAIRTQRGGQRERAPDVTETDVVAGVDTEADADAHPAPTSSHSSGIGLDRGSGEDRPQLLDREPAIVTVARIPETIWARLAAVLLDVLLELDAGERGEDRKVVLVRDGALSVVLRHHHLVQFFAGTNAHRLRPAFGRDRGRKIE